MQLSPVVLEQSPPEACGLSRRLAAILFADIAGYTRLMACDEEGTHTRKRRLHREIISPSVASHHGRIVKDTGDGFLAMFKSPLDAVRCAIVMQHHIELSNAPFPREQAIQFRMGVNIGDVIVEPGDVFGDGVNIAARLQSIAVPGGILVSESVYTNIKSRLDCRWVPLGRKRLKNIPEPVRIYRFVAKVAVLKRSRGWRAVELAKSRKIRGVVLAAILLTGMFPTIFSAEVQTVVANVPQSSQQPREPNAAPGDATTDNEVSDRLFVQELLKVIRTPDLPTEETLKRVQMSVARATNSPQALKVSWLLPEDLDLKRQKRAPDQSAADPRQDALAGRRCPPTALDDALRVDRRDSNKFYRRGQLHVMAGDYRCAIEDFDQVLQLNPENIGALNNRCWSRAIIGQFSEALADCDESLRLRPNFSDALDSRGFARLKLGQFHLAIADYDAALRLTPQRAESWYGRGVARLKLKDSAGGWSDINRAKTINSSIADEFKRYGVPSV